MGVSESTVAKCVGDMKPYAATIMEIAVNKAVRGTPDRPEPHSD